MLGLGLLGTVLLVAGVMAELGVLVALPVLEDGGVRVGAIATGVVLMGVEIRYVLGWARSAHGSREPREPRERD